MSELAVNSIEPETGDTIVIRGFVEFENPPSGTPGVPSAGASRYLTVVPVPAAITVSNSNSGNILEVGASAVVTVPSGLSAGFNFTALMPLTGVVTFTPGEGVLINGASSSVVRSAANRTIALIPTSTPNSYVLTGV